EIESLRRSRLLAASIFLAAMYGAIALWLFASDHPGTLTVDGSRLSLRVGMAGLRCLFAAAVAGLLASKVRLGPRSLRIVEYALFLGLTLLYMTCQQLVGLDLIRRGPASIPIFLAFQKNFVIQMLVLMAIYGTMIPNPASVAARPLALMLLGPI